MNILLPLSKYENDCIHLNNAVNNTIIKNGNFYRIIYSTETFSMNGLCLLLDLKNFYVEKYFDKYKCIFDIKEQSFCKTDFENIEINILKKINEKNLKMKLNLSEQIETGLIKYFSINSNIISKKVEWGKFMIKISGIWTSKNEYGTTYKFFPLKFSQTI